MMMGVPPTMKIPVRCSFVAGLLTAATLLAVRWALGDCLDTKLIGLATVVLIAPALLAFCRQIPDIAGGIAAIAFACFLAWIIAEPRRWNFFAAAMSGTMIVVGVLAGECGAIAVFRAWSLGPAPSAALTTALIAFWLAWPVWQTSGNAGVVRLHPVLVFNGVLSEEYGTWTEQPVAYRYTVLGQDVFYAMPLSPWPCVATHSAIGLLLFTVGRALSWWRNRRQAVLHSGR